MAMTPFVFTLLVLLVSVSAGVVGALLGLGGGIIVVPALTLLFGVPIRYAIGASIIAVIATSTGSAAAYVRERVANLRLAMLLETATTTGAISGAFVAGLISRRWLYFAFAAVMAYAAIVMFRGRRGGDASKPVPHDPIADHLRLHSAFDDPAEGRTIAYRVCHTRAGMGLSYLAGMISGLLGVGGGIMKVPLMNVAMRMPIKASTATSNFMIGVTAAASAGVYFMRGDVDPFIAGPVAIGVLLGARIGTKLFGQLRGGAIRGFFILLIIVIAIEMLMKGLRAG